MVLTAIVGLTVGNVALTPAQDAWDLRFSRLAKTKLVYAMKADVVDDGTEVHAELDMTLEFGALEAGKDGKVTVSWTNLHVDGNPIDEENRWELIVDPNGLLKEAVDGDEFRRMLNPIFPVFGADAGADSEWASAITPKVGTGRKLEWKSKAAGVEKLGEVETLKVVSTMTEAGDPSMKASSTWWYRRDGRPVKFLVKVENWEVPMANSNTFSATITGQLR